MLCKNHNFTIFPFGYSMTKHPITDSTLKHEFGNTSKTHSHLNLKPMMRTDSTLKHEFGNISKTHSHLNLKPMINLEQNTCIIKHLHKTH